MYTCMHIYIYMYIFAHTSVICDATSCRVKSCCATVHCCAYTVTCTGLTMIWYVTLYRVMINNCHPRLRQQLKAVRRIDDEDILVELYEDQTGQVSCRDRRRFEAPGKWYTNSFWTKPLLRGICGKTSRCSNNTVTTAWGNVFSETHPGPQTTDHRPQTTDHRPQTTDHRPQTADHRPQTTDRRPQTTDHAPRTTHYTPHTTHHTPHTTHHTSHTTMHTAHCTLHTAHCTLHTAHATRNTQHATQHRDWSKNTQLITCSINHRSWRAMRGCCRTMHVRAPPSEGVEFHSWLHALCQALLSVERVTFLLYYTILYYTILYYTILYYTNIYYNILYYNILYYTIIDYTILYYTILYYTRLYYTTVFQNITSYSIVC